MEPERASQLLKRWRDSDGEKTLGALVDTIGASGFAVIFIVLLGLPALPLPTGGITHVFEIVAMLISLQLIAGRKTVWVPRRWRGTRLDSGAQAKFIDGLIKYIGKIERFSKPRMRWVFGHRLSDVAFGVAVLLGSIAAFVAPPFTGLDTFPALGVVILAVGVIVEDIAYVVVGTALIAAAPVLDFFIGDAIYTWVKGLL